MNSASLVRRVLRYAVPLEIQYRAHQLRMRRRRRLGMLEPLVARLPRHVEPPLAAGPPLEHQRPRAALRYVEVMLLLGLREPYAAGHPEEVLQRIEHPADFRPLLVPGPGRQRRIDRRHVLVLALQDDGEQVR